MKNKRFLKIAMAFIAIFGLMACENEPLEGEFADGPVIPPGGNAHFQVDIDGETFVADQSSAQTVMGTTQVAGVTNSGKVVQLVFTGSGTGTFSLVGNGLANYTPAVGTTNLYSTALPNSTGEITITEYDAENGLISGTFSFTASRYIDPEDESAGTETLEFTNGSFTNVPLETDVDPGTEQGNFEVELDGDLYVGQTIEANVNEDGLVISAANGNQLFVIQIFDPAVGSFDLANQNDAIILYDVDNTDEQSLSYGAASGTINITAFDEVAGTVSGDFSGILTELLGTSADIEMTNGIFENITFGEETSPNEASALIDGEPFNATVFSTAFVAGTVQVEFNNDLDESIYLLFPNAISGGTYPITNSPEDYSGRYVVDVGEATETEYGSVAGTGEIVITSIANNVLVGTFNFDATSSGGETVSITNGEFTIDLN